MNIPNIICLFWQKIELLREYPECHAKYTILPKQLKVESKTPSNGFERFGSVSIHSIITIIVFIHFSSGFTYVHNVRQHTYLRKNIHSQKPKAKSQKHNRSRFIFKLLSLFPTFVVILTLVIFPIFSDTQSLLYSYVHFHYCMFVYLFAIRFQFPRPFHMHNHKCATNRITTHPNDEYNLKKKKKSLAPLPSIPFPYIYIYRYGRCEFI